MKSKIKYSDEPLTMEVVEDFLPRPEDLVPREDTVKVTIGLSKPTIEFFKTQSAAKPHTVSEDDSPLA